MADEKNLYRAARRAETNYVGALYDSYELKTVLFNKCNDPSGRHIYIEGSDKAADESRKKFFERLPDLVGYQRVQWDEVFSSESGSALEAARDVDQHIPGRFAGRLKDLSIRKSAIAAAIQNISTPKSSEPDRSANTLQSALSDRELRNATKIKHPDAAPNFAEILAGKTYILAHRIKADVNSSPHQHVPLTAITFGISQLDNVLGPLEEKANSARDALLSHVNIKNNLGKRTSNDRSGDSGQERNVRPRVGDMAGNALTSQNNAALNNTDTAYDDRRNSEGRSI